MNKQYISLKQSADTVELNNTEMSKDTHLELFPKAFHIPQREGHHFEIFFFVLQKKTKEIHTQLLETELLSQAQKIVSGRFLKMTTKNILLTILLCVM